MEMYLLCVAALCAGFINGTVGGGGLVQTPALLILLHQMPVAAIMGTAKFSSVIGSIMSAVQFSKHVTFRWQVLAAMVASAFVFSSIGARLISYLDPSVVKPLIWLLLIVVFVYMLVKKDFGITTKKEIKSSKSIVYSFLFGAIIGLYDGFLGPGTGSFLILFFVSVIGFDFLNASAHAKIVNISTNIAAFIYFVWTNNVLWEFALPMAVCNLIGAYIGSKAAILRGNKFVRALFLGIIGLMIVRYGYDIFLK
ncbi:MAG: TSUP family transporter [Saprospiraceae bacterium]|nr:TSUP family transporter [Saprospiraceae bacterium]